MERCETKQLGANDIATMVGAWKGEQDNEDTRQRVNRALDGRFEKNLVTGGTVYGYKNVPLEGVTKAVRREPDPDQAKVVQQIFTWSAEGRGAAWIAKRLAATGVKSPMRITEAGRIRRERKDAERIEAGHAPLPPIVEKWTGDGVREILMRELYRGNIVRGATKRSKRGGTKIRMATPDRVQTRHDESVVRSRWSPGRLIHSSPEISSST